MLPPQMMLLVLSLMVLSACGTVQTLGSFPRPPQELMSPPAGIASHRLKDGAKLSDVAGQHAVESTYTRRIEEQLKALQAWITGQSEVK